MLRTAAFISGDGSGGVVFDLAGIRYFRFYPRMMAQELNHLFSVFCKQKTSPLANLTVVPVRAEIPPAPPFTFKAGSFEVWEMG